MRHKKPQISTYQSNKGEDKGALPHSPPPYDSNKLKGVNLENLIYRQKKWTFIDNPKQKEIGGSYNSSLT